MVDFDEVLTYTIYKCSSSSSSYSPENIITNARNDQSSRWSTDTNNPPQYIILKLEKPALFSSIKFGKYEKTHVCNLKKFVIYAGLSIEHLVEVLDSGLRNDNIDEQFRVKNKINGNPFPCQFIKIVPIQSWGNSFNFSIWHVELSGSYSNIDSIMVDYNKNREKETIRLCLKHFRQNNFMSAFDALKESTDIKLESPIITELHTSLINGDYSEAENVLERTFEGFRQKLLMGFLTNTHLIWIIRPSGTNYSLPTNVNMIVAKLSPSMRGGHQLAMDSSAGALYLFGGWDGSSDLADLWRYNIESKVWTCICEDTEPAGGPSARSCHKMVVDPARKRIFILGRYLDITARYNFTKSDFYMYDITADTWTLLSDDTLAMGGPRLIFDHQMVFDADSQCLYVFGGKHVHHILKTTEDEPVDDAAVPIGPGVGSGSDALTVNQSNAVDTTFSGLYRYYVPTNTWSALRPDCIELKSRIAHSMLFHPENKVLYIFAGQRCKEYLNDFLIYHIDTDTVEVSPVATDGSIREYSQGAQAGYTQRATIDCELNEIYVLSGLSKDKDKRDNVKNSFWIYYINQNRWSCIYRKDTSDNDSGTKLSNFEPAPRFAHQLVYDDIKKVHYLFGGNPGQDTLPNHRLDDFWSLKLERPHTSVIYEKCRFLLRREKYWELVRLDPSAAIHFLQTKISEITNHSNKEQLKRFQKLSRLLFMPESGSLAHKKSMTAAEDKETFYSSRNKLFAMLMNYFSSEIVEPRKNLVDLVTVEF